VSLGTNAEKSLHVLLRLGALQCAARAPGTLHSRVLGAGWLQVLLQG
jgi:hypothetical protein